MFVGDYRMVGNGIKREVELIYAGTRTEKTGNVYSADDPEGIQKSVFRPVWSESVVCFFFGCCFFFFSPLVLMNFRCILKASRKISLPSSMSFLGVLLFRGKT